jgi:hypothetical protein
VAWFVFKASRFRLRNIVDETAKFDHALSALPENMVGQILDIVEVANPYTFWRACLLETHFLTAYTATVIPFIYSFSEIARPQSQFSHSCFLERFIYSQDQSTYFLQQNRQTHRGTIQ